ncbi:mechanosensitive ion channel-like protein [Aquimarina sp. MAR_2010_214]|uniref:mechanosensitive ion channel domain-containing protein n=1 Tax=Aquimarina sp. MAR_2010_214 TaxID=1250026 RepID=UPI000CC35511|nr:mechanosensitive ion channel domain-containing protein [Aquimarina sp. MAR_2010_214]PKV49445.1 mechanosensitive ion channel-like protein [Aquimarina sp. MAR_2010_214]
MIVYRDEILLSIIVLILLFFVLLITKRVIKKFAKLKSINADRRKLIRNLSYLIHYLIAGIALVIIWGVEFKQFSVFMSSVLAVLGIAFFAQWSILSNLTASIILFFSHPVRIGDRIRVLDKDFDWTGEVQDITGFYLFMVTDRGENITLPTSLVIQKGIQIMNKYPEKQIDHKEEV